MIEIVREQAQKTKGDISERHEIIAPSALLGGFCGGDESPQCALLAERQASALREQFIAVLGHDLRNPLSAIISGMDIMSRSKLDDRQMFVARLVQSSAARMSALIDDVMDFARGRLGNGMSLTRSSVQLGPVLIQVINELRSSQPKRRITGDLDVPDTVNCDPGRLSQLLSNLISNALLHGSETGPVHIRVGIEEKLFVLSVSNTGDPIPAIALSRLFQPFTRDEIRPNQQGLGLGLFIASEIARAHGGELSAKSDSKETCFSFKMPLLTPQTARIVQ